MIGRSGLQVLHSLPGTCLRRQASRMCAADAWAATRGLSTTTTESERSPGIVTLMEAVRLGQRVELSRPIQAQNISLALSYLLADGEYRAVGAAVMGNLSAGIAALPPAQSRPIYYQGMLAHSKAGMAQKVHPRNNFCHIRVHSSDVCLP